MSYGILFDHARTARIGLPEAVFCEGKPFEALQELLSRFGRGSGHPILFTRLSPETFSRMPHSIQEQYDFHPLSRTAFGDSLPPRPNGKVAVVSAGTADGLLPGRQHGHWPIWGSGTRFLRTAVLQDYGDWRNG